MSTLANNNENSIFQMSPRVKTGLSVASGCVAIVLLKSSVIGLVVVGVAGVAAGYNMRGNRDKKEV